MSDKYERVKTLKGRFMSLVETQLANDIADIDAAELGEVMDMAKDCAEIMKLCAEADYYTTIIEAMSKNTDTENAQYIDKYLDTAETSAAKMKLNSMLNH